MSKRRVLVSFVYFNTANLRLSNNVGGPRRAAVFRTADRDGTLLLLVAKNVPVIGGGTTTTTAALLPLLSFLTPNAAPAGIGMMSTCAANRVTPDPLAIQNEHQ